MESPHVLCKASKRHESFIRVGSDSDVCEGWVTTANNFIANGIRGDEDAVDHCHYKCGDGITLKIQKYWIGDIEAKNAHQDAHAGAKEITKSQQTMC